MDFEETCHIICMEGQDVDCTAAPVLNVLAVMLGPSCIEEKWTKPIGDVILTTMRRMQRLEISELIDMTCGAVRDAKKKLVK